MLVTADRRELAVIFAGGFAGALIRAVVVELWAPAPAEWPWPVFLINIAGAFILGLVVSRGAEGQPSWFYHRPLVGTGFCGALTTFSTMQVELLLMLDSGHLGLAAAYAAASVCAGIAAVALGSGLGRRERVSQ